MIDKESVQVDIFAVLVRRQVRISIIVRICKSLETKNYDTKCNNHSTFYKSHRTI